MLLQYAKSSHSLDKATYRDRMDALLRQLRSLQQACWESGLAVAVVLEGWAAAGKGTLVRKLASHMDPRGFTVHPILAPTPQEQKYPFLWRYWQLLPARGNIGIFYHSWYTHILEDRLFERISERNVPGAIGQLNAFERQLAEDGVAIAKFWIHLSQKELKQRLKRYAGNRLDAWRVRPEDWQQEKHYKQYATLAEEMLARTSTGPAPWTVVEGDCKRWARVKVLTTLTATLREALDRQRLQQQSPPAALPPQQKLEPMEPDFLAEVDLTCSLSADEYKKKLQNEQIALRELQLEIHEKQIPTLILFEGWDAAGKGGAIQRLTDVLDPRSYRVHPFGKPTDEEKAHHYLWRFWRSLPMAGQIGIFDRSWYGRVLVERIEGYASEVEWRRAYREINEFEEQLADAGYVLVKFWLHISPEVQLARFKEREEDPFKQHKITSEDWRNRDRWSDYEVAVNQAIQRTNTERAPWTLVAADDKPYARVKVIQTVTEAIRDRLKQKRRE